MDDLRDVIGWFGEGHPLRNRASLRLAELEMPDDSGRRTAATINRLLAETHDSYTLRSADVLLGQLKRARPDRQPLPQRGTSVEP